MIHDYRCTLCSVQTERWVTNENLDFKYECLNCGGFLKRIPSSPKLSYLRMGLDAASFPTAGDKWADMHEREGKEEYSPNIREL